MNQITDFRIKEIVNANGTSRFFAELIEVSPYLFGIIKITNYTRIQDYSGYGTKESALEDIHRYMNYYNSRIAVETKIHNLP